MEHNFSKFSRSIPYLNVLLKTQNQRKKLLKSFPKFVIDDILEIIYNVVVGNVKISKRRKSTLRRYKNTLENIVRTKSKKLREKIIYRQTGGFIGMLIPVIASVATSLISSLAS